MQTHFRQLRKVAAQAVDRYRTRASRGRASYIILDLETALSNNPEALELIEQLAPHLAELGPTDWTEVPMAGELPHICLGAWETVLAIWRNVEESGEDDGERLELFIEDLREELSPLQDDFRRSLGACAELGTFLTNSGRLSAAPFESYGSLQELAAEANQATASVVGEPVARIPATEQVFPDENVIVLSDRFIEVGDLQQQLLLRQAWAGVLIALAPVIEALEEGRPV